MKKHLSDIVIIVLLLIALVFVIWSITSSVAKAKIEKKENEARIKEVMDCCLKRPGYKVEIIGSPWTQEYIVCNPIK